MLGYKVALVVLTLTAGALAAPVAARAQQPHAAAPAGAQRIQFTVVGLSCPFCAYGIEKKLRHEITGLDSLGLEFERGAVTLEVHDGALVTDDQLRAVVRKAGFSVQGDIARSPLGGARSPGKGGADAR
jgi:mercuric ion binding protein